MKKNVFLLGFLCFSVVSFSQTVIDNNNDNSSSTDKAKLIALDKAGFKPAKIGEKIQVTIEGEVKYSKKFKPKYPATMVDPEKLTITNTNQLNNN